MVDQRNRFIDGVDLSETTSLTHLLDRHDADNDLEEVHIIKHSPFYSEAQFTQLLTTQAGLCILNLNIRNIYTNLEEFRFFIDRVSISSPISAICLNECWIKADSDLSSLNIPNYNMFCLRGSREGHGHCGLVIYIHEQFNAKNISFNQESTAWDYLCIEMSYKKPNSKKYILCNIYRLPGMIVEEFKIFVDEFSSFLTSIRNLKHSAFICGDYNIDLLKINSNKHFGSYFDRITAKGFFPRITLPTRLSETNDYCTNTLIDNILTNDIDDNSKSQSGILINDISDHKMIFTFQENNLYIDKYDKFIEIETKNEVSMKDFDNELKSLNIYDQLDHMLNHNPQENYDTFTHLVQFAKEKHLPKRMVKYNKKKHKKCKWMTNEILKSINKKDKMYKLLVQTPRENLIHYNTLKDNFKCFRATLRKNIREAKRLYYVRIFNIYKNDIKKTWSIINEGLKHNSKCNTQSTFILDNRMINDPEEIANSFNNYFINIGYLLSEQIRAVRPYTEYLHTPTNKRFKFIPITEEQVVKIINNLKNKSSYGHDGISNKLIKSSKEVLSKSICLLINQTLETGIFPSEIKLSKIKPLFKNGDSSLFSNYRPISLLPSFSKIYEYVIFHQLLNYMNTNNLFCVQQYGFRPGHSTELAALKITDNLIKQMDKMNIPINIYIDLSKAFDTLNHGILLDKLQYYGICDKENNVFNNYLTGRYQYVEYNGAQSSTQLITTGVPQGSVLGPLLFLIYINDLPQVCNIFDMLMYADDTTLYCNINQNSSEDAINNELKNITEWLSSNKLSLNAKKTKFMIFHTIQRKVNYPSLQINGIELERVSQFNFLGLILNSQLTWIHHMNHISKKISRVIGIMYRLKHIYPQTVLLMLYNTLILPHFSYCILLWGSKVIDGHSIHILQKKALRIITNEDFVAHSEPICKRLNLVKVTDMFRLAIWKFYYKLINHALPSYFQIMIPTLPRICDTYEIRKPTFHLPAIKHDYAEQLIGYQLVKILNGENQSILITSKVHTHSFHGFKLYIKNKVINSYRELCYYRNCYTCTRRERRVSE